VTNKTAAVRYARALFDVALKEQADLEQIERQLGEFADLFKQYPELEKVLFNPAVPVPRKRAAVVEVLSRAKFGPVVTKLLTLLAEREILNGRLVAPLAGRSEDIRYIGHYLVFPKSLQQRSPLRIFAHWLGRELNIDLMPLT